MELNEYQEKAMSTCMDTCDNFSYMMLNLVGEVGEFSSKVAKAIRKGKIAIRENEFNSMNILLNINKSPKECRYEESLYLQELKKEAGDILWQLSGLCKVMGWRLEDVAQMNLDKLQARKKAGTIDGSGDGVTKEERCK